MQKIVEKDKYLHIAVSTALVCVLFPFIGLWHAVLITALIGLSKELIYDKLFGLGNCDIFDFVADLIGIFLGIISVCIYQAISVVNFLKV